MTELLEQVIAQLKALSADEQDEIASRLLAEMDEQTWKTLYESAPDDQWHRIAQMVQQEHGLMSQSD